MKKLVYLIAIVFLSGIAACNKKGDGKGNCNLPSTNVPAELVGKWANGYTSFTNVVDAYNGRILGNTWQSGRYLEMKANGKNATLYIMGGSMFSEFATYCEGTVSINEAAGTLQFNVCYAHYRGWNNGTKTVDRDATDSEKNQLSNNLQFFYGFDGDWFQLRFSPDGTPTSFRSVD